MKVFLLMNPALIVLIMEWLPPHLEQEPIPCEECLFSMIFYANVMLLRMMSGIVPGKQSILARPMESARPSSI